LSLPLVRVVPYERDTLTSKLGMHAHMYRKIRYCGIPYHATKSGHYHQADEIKTDRSYYGRTAKFFAFSPSPLGIQNPNIMSLFPKVFAIPFVIKHERTEKLSEPK
jgi:hypothetical protein